MSTAATDPGLVRVLGFNRDLVLVGWGDERFVLNARQRDVARVDPSTVEWVDADEEAPSYARELVQAMRLTRMLSASDARTVSTGKFQPPPTVREWAARGLELSERVGAPLRARTRSVAQALANGDPVSRSLVAEMVSEFATFTAQKEPLRRRDGTWTPTGVAWCVDGSSKILMGDGSVQRIKDIVEKRRKAEVMAFDEETGELRPAKIIGWHRRKAKRQEWYRIRPYEHIDPTGLEVRRHPFSSPTWTNYKIFANACGMRAILRATGNHLAWTPQGWRALSEIGDAPVAEVQNDLDDVGWSTLFGQMMGGRTGDHLSLLAEGQRGWTAAFRYCPRNWATYDALHQRIRLFPRWIIPSQLQRGYQPRETEKGSRRLNWRNCSHNQHFLMTDTLAARVLPWFTEGTDFEVASGAIQEMGPAGWAAWVVDAGFVEEDPGGSRYIVGLPGPDIEAAWHERVGKELLSELGMADGIRVVRSDLYQHAALEISGDAAVALSAAVAPFIAPELRSKVLPEHITVPHKLADYVPPSQHRLYWRQPSAVDRMYDIDTVTASPENLASGRHRDLSDTWVYMKYKYDLTVEGLNSYVANGVIVHNCAWGGDAGRSWSMKAAQQPDDAMVASGDWLHDTLATLVAAAEAEEEGLAEMFDEGDYDPEDDLEGRLFRAAYPDGYPEDDDASEFAGSPVANLPVGEGEPVDDVQEEVDDGYTSEERAQNVKSQPRDSNGRFASKGARFTAGDGRRGKIENIVGDNAEIRYSDGSTAVLPVKDLAVDQAKRPKASIPAGLEPIADVKAEIDKFLNDFMVSQATTTQASGSLYAAGEGQTQQGGTQPLYMAVVDDVDKEAVLDLIAVLPPDPQTGGTLRVFKRENKTWVAAPDYAQDIQGLDPPSLIKLDMDLVKSVTEQIDNFVEGQPVAEQGAPIEPGTSNPIAAAAGAQSVASLYDEYGNIRR